VAKLARGRAPRVRSAVAFTLPEREFLPEGIAWDPVSGDFFVSSVRLRKIVRVGADGRVSDFSRPEDGLWAVLALKIDPRRRRLWACSAALPEMAGFSPELRGRTAMFRYDLTTGALVRTYQLPEGGGDRAAKEAPRPEERGGATSHAFNDLEIDARGDVYISDSLSSALYLITEPRDELELFLEPGRFRSPNGLALSKDGRRLYVADYGGEIAIVDPETKAVSALEHPADVPLWGIDGLVRYGRSLMAIQNGIRPYRVVRLDLDRSGRRVKRGTILELDHPKYVAPTLGVMDGGALYYVANAQWDSFDWDGTLWPVERLYAPVILKLPVGR
jgi:hypothetical protein